MGPDPISVDVTEGSLRGRAVPCICLLYQSWILLCHSVISSLGEYLVLGFPGRAYRKREGLEVTGLLGSLVPNLCLAL